MGGHEGEGLLHCGPLCMDLTTQGRLHGSISNNIPPLGEDRAHAALGGLEVEARGFFNGFFIV